MAFFPILLVLATAADPAVARLLGELASAEGDERAAAVAGYVAGCKGKSRFAYKNNAAALPPLRTAFTDEEPKVRLAALDLTACFAAADLAEELKSAIQDGDEAVREKAYGEAAHAPSVVLAAGLAEQVQRCDGKEATARWCVFALFALAENAQALKEDGVKTRAADLAAPLARSENPKLREHALRTLGLLGTRAHAAALTPLLDGTVKISAEEKRQAKEVQGKLGKR